MPDHQGIEKGAKIAKKNIFDFLSFWSGLNIIECFLDGRTQGLPLHLYNGQP